MILKKILENHKVRPLKPRIVLFLLFFGLTFFLSILFDLKAMYLGLRKIRLAHDGRLEFWINGEIVSSGAYFEVYIIILLGSTLMGLGAFLVGTFAKDAFKKQSDN